MATFDDPLFGDLIPRPAAAGQPAPKAAAPSIEEDELFGDLVPRATAPVLAAPAPAVLGDDGYDYLAVEAAAGNAALRNPVEISELGMLDGRPVAQPAFQVTPDAATLTGNRYVSPSFTASVGTVDGRMPDSTPGVRAVRGGALQGEQSQRLAEQVQAPTGILGEIANSLGRGAASLELAGQAAPEALRLRGRNLEREGFQAALRRRFADIAEGGFQLNPATGMRLASGAASTGLDLLQLGDRALERALPAWTGDGDVAQRQRDTAAQDTLIREALEYQESQRQNPMGVGATRLLSPAGDTLGEQAGAMLEVVRNDPAAVGEALAAILPESLLQSIPTIAGGAGGAIAGGPTGAAAGAALGGGLTGGVLQYVPAITEYLDANGLRIDQLNQPQVLADALAYAETQAKIGAATEGLAGAVGGANLVPAGAVRNTIARELASDLVAQPVAQGVIGATGAAAQQVAGDRPLNLGELVAEFAGEAAMGPIEAAPAGLARLAEARGLARLGYTPEQIQVMPAEQRRAILRTRTQAQAAQDVAGAPPAAAPAPAAAQPAGAPPGVAPEAAAAVAPPAAPDMEPETRPAPVLGDDVFDAFEGREPPPAPPATQNPPPGGTTAAAGAAPGAAAVGLRPAAADADLAPMGAERLAGVQVAATAADVPADIVAKLGGDLAGVEGFYDPDTGQVFVIEANLGAPARTGMTPAQRKRWVVAHERTGHAGLRGAAVAGEGAALGVALGEAARNPTAKAIADAMLASEQGRSEAERASPQLLLEEALSELAAAAATGDYGAIEARYGVKVPQAQREGVRAMLARLYAAMRRAFGLEGVNDDAIRTILADARRYADSGRVAGTSRKAQAQAQAQAAPPPAVLGDVEPAPAPAPAAPAPAPAVAPPAPAPAPVAVAKPERVKPPKPVVPGERQWRASGRKDSKGRPILEPVLDYGRDGLLQWLGASGGVDFDELQAYVGADPALLRDGAVMRPFGRVGWSALRRNGGMPIDALVERMLEDGWIDVDDRAAAADLVMGAVNGREVLHPTRGHEARLDRAQAHRDAQGSFSDEPDPDADVPDEVYVPGFDEDEERQAFDDVPFSRAGSGDLFGQPTPRERVDAERRRRDAKRDGKTATGRTDMAAGEGELFAGRRPQQADLEGGVEASFDLFAPTRGQRAATVPPAEQLKPDGKTGLDRPHRPDYTPALGKRGANAVDELLRRYGGSVVADAIVRDFREKGTAELLGQRVGTADDLAAIAHVYRNPMFEVLRYVFTDADGNIVGESAVSARMTSAADLFPQGQEPMAWLSRQAKRANAAGVWLMHNHPSGNPTPSRADIRATTALRDAFASMGVTVRGHIVLNHDVYASIAPDGTVIGDAIPIPSRTGTDPLLSDAPEARIGRRGEAIEPSRVAAAGKVIYERAHAGKPVLFYVDAGQRITLAANFDVNTLLASGRRALGALAQLGKRSRASMAFVVMSRSDYDSISSGTFRMAANRGLLTEIVVIEPNGTAVAAGVRDMRTMGSGFNTPSWAKRQARDSSSTQLYEDTPGYTDTPAFRRWFGDSKVVDANGDPLVVHHGSGAKFDTFDMQAAADGAHWFVADKDHAETFGPSRAFYLSIQNPAVITQDDLDAAWDEEHPDGDQDERDLLPRDFVADFVNMAKEDGKDGLLIKGMGDRDGEFDMWLAFRPEQIKSATANSGAFDPADPSILASRAPTFYSAALRAIEGAPARNSADGWKGWLDGAVRRGEMKQSERDWLGIDAWLGGQRGPVKREALADYVRANQVRIKEHYLGAPLDFRRRYDAINSEIGAIIDRHGKPIHEITGPDRDRIEQLMAEHDAVAEEERKRPDREKFGQYTLRGGSAYRELLLSLDRPGRTFSGSIKFRDTGDVTAEEALDDFLSELSMAGHEEWDYGRVETGVEGEGLFEFTGFSDDQLRELRRIAKEGGIDPADVDFDVDKGGSEAPEVYTSPHWSQPNVLAHVRFNERMDPSGNPVLFIEEIQSDWHQAGRKRGYSGSLPWVLHDPDTNTALSRHATRAEADAALDAALANGGHRRLTTRMEARTDSVPDAPLKGTDEWAMLAFRRMVRFAAERGFDRIAWTTGIQQAKRYDLSKQISRIHFDDNSSGGASLPRMDGEVGAGMLYAYDLGGREVMATPIYKPEEIADYVGKEVADRLLAAKPEMATNAGAGVRRRRLSGLQLRVGGEGMRAFYDKILPAAVNRWAKKFGGKVSTSDVYTEVVGKAPWRVLDRGEHAALRYQVARGRFGEALATPFETREEAAAEAERRNLEDASQPASKQPSLEITPAMRDAALDGLPLFSRAPDLRSTADAKEAGTAEQLRADAREAVADLGKLATALSPRRSLAAVNRLRALVFDSMRSRARTLEARHPKAAALRSLFDLYFEAPGHDRLVPETIPQATEARRNVFLNRIERHLEAAGLHLGRMTPTQNRQLRNALLGVETDLPPNIRGVAELIRREMDVQKADAANAGIDIGEVTDIGYLTRLYDDEKITANEADFLRDATNHYRTHEWRREVGAPRDVLYGDGTFARFVAALRRAAAGNPVLTNRMEHLRTLAQSYRSTSNTRGESTAIRALVAEIYDEVAADWARRKAVAWLHAIRTPDISRGFNGLLESGAPVTRARTLAGAADLTLQQWMRTDVREILRAYADTMAAKIEEARRVGTTPEILQGLLNDAAAQGVPMADLEEAVRILDTVTGSRRFANPTAQTAVEVAGAWTYLTLLGRGLFASLYESAAYSLRTGQLRHTISPLIMLGRALSAPLGNTRNRELRRLAVDIGVNGHRAVEDAMMATHVGGDVTNELVNKVTTRFFRGIWLTQLTEAQRAYGVGASVGYLKSLARQHQQAARAGRASPSSLYLNELGIADHDEFAAWILRQPAVPKAAELFDQDGRPTPMGDAFMVATRRLVNQSIQNVRPEHRTGWQNSAHGRIFGAIMGYAMASYTNLLRREFDLSNSLRKHYGTGAAARRGAIAAASVAGIYANALIVSTLREALFNQARFEDKDDEEILRELTTLAAQRTFGLGAVDPIVQMVTGLKYRKSITETAAGATIGTAAQDIQRIARALSSENTPATETDEYRAMESVYRSMITPLLNVVLSRIPFLSGIAIPVASGSNMRKRFAGLFFTEPDVRSDLDDDYMAATKQVTGAKAAIEDRLGSMPRKQWAAELKKIKSEYPTLLQGLTLDRYAVNAANRKLGRAGAVKVDDQGNPQLKFVAPRGGAGSLYGELEGYPAGKSTTDGLRDTISDLTKSINNIRRERDIRVDDLVALAGDVRGGAIEQARERQQAGDGRKLAGARLRNAVIDDLLAERRKLKRATVLLVRQAEKGGSIERGAGRAQLERVRADGR